MTGSNTGKAVEKVQTTSPFYLHPSEGPGSVITTVQLKGDNYEDWAKHVRNALRTKRKMGFVDGTLKKPEDRSDAVGFAVQAANRNMTGTFQYREKDTTCTHCGKYGHEISDCFQIKGYPDWWGERGRSFGDGRGAGNRGGRGRFGRGGGAVGSFGRGRGSNLARANVAQMHPETIGTAHSALVQPVANSVATTRREGEYDRASLPQLSDEQVTALIGFLNNQKKSEPAAKLSGKTEMIIDSGASHHMTSNIDFLTDVTSIAPCSIRLPDGDRAMAEKQGRMCLGGDVWLNGVLYSPDLTCSLISVAKLLKTTKGSVTFTEDLCVLQDRTSKMIGAGEECDGVYKFRGIFGGQANKTTCSVQRDLWHRRLGHPSDRVLSYLSSSFDVGKTVETDGGCEICYRAKQTRDSFSESINKANGIFDLIHCDVWGAYRTPSTSGAVYFLTIVDDYSRAVWIYLLLEKREVSECLQKFCAMVTRQFDKKVRAVRSDNGTEFTSLRRYFEEEGILHQTSCVYTPQQNGRVERKHRHILNVARSLMFQASLPVKFWGECALAASHLINRTPTPLLQGKTPYEVLYGKPPSFDTLKVFGCLGYAHKISRDKDKFCEKSRKCVFMGYPYGKKGWMMYDLETQDFFVSRDVHFHETIFPFETSTPENKQVVDSPPDLALFFDNDFVEVQDISVPLEGPQLDVRGSVDENGGLSPPPSADLVIEPSHEIVNVRGSVEESAVISPPLTQERVEQPMTEQLGRGHRQKFQSTRLQNYVVSYPSQKQDPDPSPSSAPTTSSNSGTVTYPIAHYVSCDRFSASHSAFLAAITAECEPESYNEAMKLQVWRDAVSFEVDALEEQHTWDIEDLPPGKTALGCRFVFKIKYNSDGTIERHKARLVVMGNCQKEGKDYKETFAPVVKLTTVRMFLKVAAAKNWIVHQMDVHNAFLHGDLEEEVYMKLPPGFKASGPNKVCKLKKSLYGLKQAPRCWFSKLTNALLAYGFVQSYSDYSLFALTRGKMCLYVIIYVDDLLIGGNDEDAIGRFKGYLNECFHMKDLGSLKYFLGIEVARSSKGIYLSQRKYALDIINECGLLGGRPVSTPIIPNHKLEEDTGDYFDSPDKYRRLVGRLVYLAITRPELTYVVHVLAQFLHQPRTKHWWAALRVVRYLKSSPGQGILLTSDGDLNISAYCDSDFNTCPISRRSLTGFAVLLGGSPIAWKTKKQGVVSKSSAEAEYRAMSFTTSELKWICSLLSDFGVSSADPIKLYCDNKAALHIAANPVFHERTKHIERDCHYIRDEIQNGLLQTFYIPTNQQPADIFTKALGIQAFEYLRGKLGICDLHAPT